MAWWVETRTRFGGHSRVSRLGNSAFCATHSCHFYVAVNTYTRDCRWKPRESKKVIRSIIVSETTMNSLCLALYSRTNLLSWSVLTCYQRLHTNNGLFSTSQSCTNIFHRNSHLLWLHTQYIYIGNNWLIIIWRLSLINVTVWPVFPVPVYAL